MTAPGPCELGRGVIVRPGSTVPAPWSACERVVVDSETVKAPTSAVEGLQRAWSSRTPVVVELAVEPGELRAPERDERQPHELDPSFEFALERLHFLVWANNYDAREGEPVWWHGRKAARFPGVVQDGEEDVRGDDGRGFFVDGGPADPPRLRPERPTVHRWNAESGYFRPAGHGQPASVLAPDQLAAVVHPSGAARVIAPAGSGKTRVLAERLRHLVVDRGVDPATITALAFNTKAAAQLRERCADFVTERGPNLRTLNSIALWICQRFGDAGRPQVLEEPAARELVQRVFDVRRQSNADTVAPYLDGLSVVRLRLLAPQVAEEMVPDAAGLAERFEDYRAALYDAGALDFDEQIYRAIEILLRDPASRAAARGPCRRLLVDEFQDLTPAHMLLIRLLAAPAFDCFGVGDDDQVIYGYAGAAPEFLLRYGQYFPGAGEHFLEVNYRCPVEIVTAARHLLSYNDRRVLKTITAAAAPAAGSLGVRCAPPEELAAVATDQVRSWLGDGAGLSDVAVLARVNSALLPVQVALGVAGIPCDGPLTPAVLSRTGIRTALAYLRIGLDPGHIARGDITETIRRPSRGIAPKVGEMLTRSATTSISGIDRLATRLTGRDVPKLEAFSADLARVAVACRTTTLAALRVIRLEVGLGDTMDTLDSSRSAADRSTHTDDLVALESVAALHPEVASFEAWLRTALEAGPPDGPAVVLSTVHRMKGREWDRVIVFGASRGLFPHRLSNDEEEERRVFHVAITRARLQAVVVGDSGAPSPFLAELDGSAPKRPPGAARVAGGNTSPGGAATARAAAAPRPLADRGSEPTAVEQALRDWRRTTASRAGVPAYVVLNDQELIGVAGRLPATLAELSRCRGMGPIRLERYGDEILAVIQAAVEEGDP